MKIAVCDDDITQIRLINSFLREYKNKYPEIEMSAFTSGDQLMASYKKGCRYTVVFLDIVMDGASGIEAAEVIRRYDQDVILIFISNYTHFVFNVFSYNAFQFLVKPISKEKFDREMKRVDRTLQLKHHKYMIKWSQDVSTVDIEDITFLEGYNRHVMVHTIRDEVYKTIGKLNEEEFKLKQYHFVRVHQGFLVNMKYIRVIEGYSIILVNDKEIPISVRKRSDVLTEYNKYLSGCAI